MMVNPPLAQKTLILRLSSLGDVILATSVLQVDRLKDQQIHWVVARDYAEVLKGHPKIQRLWEFDKKGGLKGWVAFCRELYAEGFGEVIDLHRSLRTTLARVLFAFWGLRGGGPRWRRVSKERFRFYGLMTFKRFWPQALFPTRKVNLFARTAGGTGQERPDFKHLGTEAPRFAQPYFCIMPSSRWEGKRWPVEYWVNLVRVTGIRPVVLGTAQDHASVDLVSAFQRIGIAHESGVGVWSLAQTAEVLKNAEAYLGMDTGLAHLAEAVGTPARIIFGPTLAEQGFGPWKSESLTASQSLWCRPCGKDGRFCFRIESRYQCLRDLKPKQVLAQWNFTKRSGTRESK